MYKLVQLHSGKTFIKLNIFRYQTMQVALEYIVRERGPMTSLGGVEGLAFVNTKYAPESGTWPDIQFHFAPSSINSDPDQVKSKVKILPFLNNVNYKLCTNFRCVKSPVLETASTTPFTSL